MLDKAKLNNAAEEKSWFKAAFRIAGVAVRQGWLVEGGPGRASLVKSTPTARLLPRLSENPNGFSFVACHSKPTTGRLDDSTRAKTYQNLNPGHRPI